MRTPSDGQDFGAFQRQAHFPGLDGLRAISVLLVITNHVPGAPWTFLPAGWLGVWIFFAISGFLITTLLIRDEREANGARLGAFYVRRTFRILPSYFATMLLYAVAVQLPGQEDGRAEFYHGLPYFLTFCSELINWPGFTTFGHSWSIGVEEKFYIVLPLVGFLALRQRPNARVLALVMAIAIGVAIGSKLSMCYATLGLGALAAEALGRPASFLALRAAARFAPTPIVACIAMYLFARVAGAHHAAYLPIAISAVLIVVAALFSSPGSWLNHAWLRYVGRRSYGIYLLHALVMHVVMLVLSKVGVVNWWITVAFTTLTSVAAAECMYRSIEGPCIRLGRRLATSVSPPSALRELAPS